MAQGTNTVQVNEIVVFKDLNVLLETSRHVILPKKAGHTVRIEEGRQAIEIVAYRSRSEHFLLAEVRHKT